MFKNKMRWNEFSNISNQANNMAQPIIQHMQKLNQRTGFEKFNPT